MAVDIRLGGRAIATALKLGETLTGSSYYSIEKIANGRSGGTTQAETRVYNERLVLALVRRNGPLSKSELTRLTGLAPQTITTIVNRAAGAGLLLRCDPLRGRLGQPSVPYSLNPEGAFAFGLKIDHRSADVALVNFTGEIKDFERITFDYPTPDQIMSFAKLTMARMRRKHKAATSERIAGLGIASPFYQWNWDEDAGATASGVAAWRQVDIRAELDRLVEFPVFLFNDATVAAGAELMFGPATGRADFLYAYVGYMLGGALVIDHHLFPGRNGLAGNLGRIPVPAKQGQSELIKVASLQALKRTLNEEQQKRIWSTPHEWPDLGPALPKWIETVAEGLTLAVRSAVALLDIDNVVVDGAIPAPVRREIVKSMRRKLARSFLDRPEPFAIHEGAFGHLAPVIGGASVPLLVKYSNDKDLLFKD